MVDHFHLAKDVMADQTRFQPAVPPVVLATNGSTHSTLRACDTGVRTENGVDIPTDSGLTDLQVRAGVASMFAELYNQGALDEDVERALWVRDVDKPSHNGIRSVNTNSKSNQENKK